MYTNWAKLSSLVLTEQEETNTKYFAIGAPLLHAQINLANPVPLIFKVLGIFNFGYTITSKQRAKTWLYLSSSFNIIRENYEEFAFHLLDDWAVSLKDAYHRGCCCCFGLPLAYWKDFRTLLGSLPRQKLTQFLFNRVIVYLKYSCTKNRAKTCKNKQTRAKTCISSTHLSKKHAKM